MLSARLNHISSCLVVRQGALTTIGIYGFTVVGHARAKRCRMGLLLFALDLSHSLRCVLLLRAKTKNISERRRKNLQCNIKDRLVESTTFFKVNLKMISVY